MTWRMWRVTGRHLCLLAGLAVLLMVYLTSGISSGSSSSGRVRQPAPYSIRNLKSGYRANGENLDNYGGTEEDSGPPTTKTPPIPPTQTPPTQTPPPRDRRPTETLQPGAIRLPAAKSMLSPAQQPPGRDKRLLSSGTKTPLFGRQSLGAGEGGGAEAVSSVHNQDIPRIRPKLGLAGRPVKPNNGPQSVFNLADVFGSRPLNVAAAGPIRYGHNLTVVGLNEEFDPTRRETKGAKQRVELGAPVWTALGRQMAMARAAARIRGAPASSVKEMAVPERRQRMEIVGGLEVGQVVPVTAARNIIIATSWRSGSTFLGDLLNHYPGTFYYFEPLHYKASDDGLNRPEFLDSLLRCNFTKENLGYLHHVAKASNRFLFKNHNFRLWTTCHNLLPQETMCFLPDYLRTVCPLYPVKLIKTVRTRVKELETLLENQELGLKVIVLVRDPRGVYLSRSAGQIKTWCKDDKCASPRVGCADLLSDTQAVTRLSERFPGRITLVRYEDLSLETEDTTRSLLKFLDLPWTDSIDQYIQTHTETDGKKRVKNQLTKKVELKVDPYATTRNSTATAFKWRESLPWDNLTEIQEECSAPMASLGYKLLASEADRTAPGLPIELDPATTWPRAQDPVAPAATVP